MKMKKFINNPENLVQELLEGYVLAYPHKVKLARNNLVVRAVPKGLGKVGIVTLGGSGHEPGLSGFVGMGMLDASVPGEIFAAPGAPRCLEAIKLADRGAGVLFVVLNHPGDVISSNITMELAKKQGLNVKMVLTQEDIASGPRDKPEERRGLIGFLPVYKVAGAAAEEGQSLDEIKVIAERMATEYANSFRRGPYRNPPLHRPGAFASRRRRDGDRRRPARGIGFWAHEAEDRRRDGRDHAQPVDRGLGG